ncbi:hypothetical protein RvY_16623 [Ramazzottius varieornatus]|uniref:Guanylate cyclase domain-containing protein n=1 Tax=Ramazzottius varieornatus TaxID=947166 RepID=A0A1D1W1V1_RAMVA|nr:hypothetical protein RvY_16623 [Ramazzottius varieornatus]
MAAETLAVPQLASGPPVVVEAPTTGQNHRKLQSTPMTEDELKVPRSSIRASIQASFLLRPKAAAEQVDPLLPVNSTTIKVVPYINARQVTGIALLVLWPILLGTAFNLYGFQEASAYLDIRLGIQHYVQRWTRTQQLSDLLVQQQDLLLGSIIQKDGKANDIAKQSSQVSYRIRDCQTFGNYAYRKTAVGKPIDPTVRRPLLQRVHRVIMSLDLYAKYTLPDYQLENVKKVCGNDCQWNFLRTRDVEFWRALVRPIVSLGKSGVYYKVLATANISTDSNITVVALWKLLTDELLYPIVQADIVCTRIVEAAFEEDFHISVAVFAVILAFLIAWFVFAPNLLLLVSTSLAGIFSESYRFQWIQLCRRRAIEREKSRSDKIVQEMFFEVNFKYLYEGNLPPTVLYNEATIAFVELMQYDELCKIYTTVDHVALLDWYYHLVNASVKGFNTNVVATAGHYCLLAGTHAYHAQNVALSMLRLMTLVKESYLPPPHNTRLPLIRAGIHTGAVAGCIVSLKFPLFTMLGDTVNTSARMNSKSKPFRVLLSELSNQMISSSFVTESAGVFNVKGKGEMKTFHLLACKWRTFSEYFIDLGEADRLAKLHDLEAIQTPGRNLRRTGFGQTSNNYNVFDVDHGRRRSSSENDGSIAMIGGNLLQGLLKRMKRKKSSIVDKKEVLVPLVFPEPAMPRSGDNVSYSLRSSQEVSGQSAPKERKASYKDYTVPRLSRDIDVKASPNESYYMQISNNIFTRSWNAHRDSKTKEKNTANPKV